MTNRPLYIFDLDGTIALNDHRQHLVRGDKKDWDAFFEACDEDQPNNAVIETLQILMEEADVWVWSGRSDAVMDKTIDWLYEHGVFPDGFFTLPEFIGDPDVARCLKMRPAGDHTPDEQLKEFWFKSMRQEDRDRLVAVFDDRAKVVRMWRSNGVTCFQVAEGDF